MVKAVGVVGVTGMAVVAPEAAADAGAAHLGGNLRRIELGRDR